MGERGRGAQFPVLWYLVPTIAMRRASRVADGSMQADCEDGDANIGSEMDAEVMRTSSNRTCNGDVVLASVREVVRDSDVV